MIGSLQNKLKESFDRYRTDPEYRELIKTSSVSLLVRMIGVGTGFLVTLVTSRYFSANALGIVSICVAILSLAGVAGKLGLDVAMMRLVAEYSWKNDFAAIKGLYITALRLMVPVTLLISIVLYFSADWMAGTIFHKDYLASYLRINAWLTLPLVSLLFHSESTRGLKNITSYTFYQTSAVSTLALILLVGAVFTGHVAREVPVEVQFVSIAVAGVLSLWSWLRASQFTLHKSRTGEKSSGLLKIAMPMFTTTVLQLIMSWAGTLILASYATESQVGIYNALVRISVFTNITILAINSITMPRFAEAHAANDRDALKRYSHQAARLIFLTSLPIFIGLACFPHLILSVFGKEFPGNESSLYVLLAGQFIVVVSGLPAQILNMTGRQHVLRNIAIVSSIANVGSCLLFIPAWGILGASLAQVVGTLIWSVLCIWNVKKHFGFFTFAQLRG
ncbi:MAG: flippase [Bacteroidetes bacterium]|nr:flippase [Bacteroidota bacterium]MBL0138562.1 flippase [Bacteroidota bacterium]